MLTKTMFFGSGEGTWILFDVRDGHHGGAAPPSQFTSFRVKSYPSCVVCLSFWVTILRLRATCFSSFPYPILET